MIQLTPVKWDQLLGRLRQDYPPSVTLVRASMRRELGFVTRHHQQWNGSYYRQEVCLDFFDDRLESWFVLKYAEYL